jgi:hypothetical protein
VKKRRLGVVGFVALAAVSVLAACSGKVGTLEGAGAAAESCNASTVFAQGAASGDPCAVCLVDSCKPELNAYWSGCSDLIQCVCSAGAGASECSAKAQEPSCIAAGMPLALCIEQRCRVQCLGAVDGGRSN